MNSNGLQRIFQVPLTFRSAKVRQENYLSTLRTQELNRWKTLSDPRIVRNPNFAIDFFGWNVEIDTGHHPLTFYIKVTHR
jgi:hypothetical protein